MSPVVWLSWWLQRTESKIAQLQIQIGQRGLGVGMMGKARKLLGKLRDSGAATYIDSGSVRWPDLGPGLRLCQLNSEKRLELKCCSRNSSLWDPKELEIKECQRPLSALTETEDLCPLPVKGRHQCPRKEHQRVSQPMAHGSAISGP